jgi:uncharacterized membrane protein YeiB
MFIGIIVLIIAVIAILYGFSEEETWPKVTGYVGVAIAIIFIVIHFNTAQGQRMVKSWTSNTTGGLERIVEVYDQSGKLVKTYEGKLDVQDTEYGNKVLFDLNGKRTVIYNATVIVQEK